ncbi:MAG: AMP-dependent synthetase/ligase [bacterium]
MRTVLNLLKEAINKYPDSAYLSDKTENGWLSKTYYDVDQESDKLAAGLINDGVKKGEHIAILSEGRSSWVIAEYAILKTGGTAVPLSVKLLPEEVLFRLNHSESTAIFVSKHTLNLVLPVWKQLKNNHVQLICFDSDEQTKSKLESVDHLKYSFFHDLIQSGEKDFSKNEKILKKRIAGIKEDDVVTISYTSGTTGNPKGIMLTHLNYYSNSRDAYQYFQLPSHYKTLIILPLDHSFAHTVGIYISLLCALSIHFVDGRGGPVQTLKNIPVNLNEVKPDMLLTVPALTGNFMKKIIDGIHAKGGIAKQLFNAGLKHGKDLYRDGYTPMKGFNKMIKSIPYQIANQIVFKKVRGIFGGNLKFCVGGGALLDIKQQHFFYSIGVPVYQGYGLTEATPIISANCEHTHKLGTSGKLINNVECEIYQPDPETGKGEIVIRGNNVMKGYYKNKEATEETIYKGWLHTGDMGYFDQDGFLMVVGREKALLIAEDGEKYSPEEIEEAIVNSSLLIYQVMLYNDHQKYTTAIITLDESNVKKIIEQKSIKNEHELLDEIKQSFFQYRLQPEYKNAFPAKWEPSVFRIAEAPFSEKNKMINSTMKMVRHNITETYSDLIKQIYQEGRQSFYSPHNLNILKNRFFQE